MSETKHHFLKSFLLRPLQIERVELRIIDLPQREPFQSAIGFRHSRQALILRLWDRQGGFGYGEVACRPDPYYSHEFLHAALALLRDLVCPRWTVAMSFDTLLSELGKVRGWYFTKAAVIEAVCDLWRRQGLQDPLEAWKAPEVSAVPVGISLGLYNDNATLLKRIESAVIQGYQRIKLKVKPGLPEDYLRHVRDHFPDLALGLDANGSFEEADLNEAAAVEAIRPLMFEQPFGPDRLDLSAQLKDLAPDLKICLDESILGPGSLKTALKLGAIDELNLKPGRVGGQIQAIHSLDIADAAKLPVWIGGMFETGIGRSANLRVAAHCPNAIGHDLSPSTRYFVEDILETPLDMDTQGRIKVPQKPCAVCEKTLGKYTERLEVVKIKLKPGT